MLSPQQKATTLVQILFRATHTYSKDSKIRCLVNWSKNRVALVHLHTPIKRQALSNHFLLVTKKAIQSILSLSSWFIIGKRIFSRLQDRVWWTVWNSKRNRTQKSRVDLRPTVRKSGDKLQTN